MQFDLVYILMGLAVYIALSAHFQAYRISFKPKNIMFYATATSIQIAVFVTVYFGVLVTDHATYVEQYREIFGAYMFVRLLYTFFIYGNYAYRFSLVFSHNMNLVHFTYVITAIIALFQVIGAITQAVFIIESASIPDYRITLTSSRVIKFPEYPTSMSILDAFYSAVMDAIILTRLYRVKTGTAKCVDIPRLIRFAHLNGISLVANIVSAVLGAKLKVGESVGLIMLSNECVCSLTFDFLSFDLGRFYDSKSVVGSMPLMLGSTVVPEISVMTQTTAL